jgi:hypothetical protein
MGCRAPDVLLLLWLLLLLLLLLLQIWPVGQLPSL